MGLVVSGTWNPAGESSAEQAERLQGRRTAAQRVYFDDIAATVQANGGVITTEDLAAYRVRWLQPLQTEFNGHKLYMMPPPSSGGAVIKAAFELFERVEIQKQAPLGVPPTRPTPLRTSRRQG